LVKSLAELIQYFIKYFYLLRLLYTKVLVRTNKMIAVMGPGPITIKLQKGFNRAAEFGYFDRLTDKSVGFYTVLLQFLRRTGGTEQ